MKRLALFGKARHHSLKTKENETMTKLSTSERNKLSASTFAGPDRSYPVPDKSHAANAKARASQAVNAGRMSKGQEGKIDAKANKVLAKGLSGRGARGK
jgi:hypothetical protein